MKRIRPPSISGRFSDQNKEFGHAYAVRILNMASDGFYGHLSCTVLWHKTQHHDLLKGDVCLFCKKKSSKKTHESDE